MITVVGGLLIAIYGRHLISKLGGGIIQKMVECMVIIAFLLTAFIVLTLSAFLMENELAMLTALLTTFGMSTVIFVLAYFIKKFSDELTKMEGGV